jgi:hypothetical protein
MESSVRLSLDLTAGTSGFRRAIAIATFHPVRRN